MSARGALLGLFVVVVLVHLWWPGGAAGQVTYLGGGFAGAAAAWWGLSSRSDEKRGWKLGIAAALTLTWLGDVVFELLTIAHGAPPDASIADAGWIGCYVALAAGLLWMISTRTPTRRRLESDAFVDVAVVLVASLVVVWEVSLASLVSDDTLPWGVRAIWAAYPVFDCMILALVVRLAVSKTMHRRESAWVGAGVLCWLVSDFGFMATGGGTSRWLDLGWLAGSGLMAAAFLGTERSPRSAESVPAGGRVGRWRVALCIAPMFVPWLIELEGFSRGVDPDPVPMFIATALLGALAMARGFGLVVSVDNSIEAVRHREGHFRALALNSSDAVLVIDATGTLVTERHNIHGLVGTLRQPPEDTPVVPVSDVLHPVSVDEYRAIFNRSLESPGVVVSGTLQVNHSDGSKRWLAVRVVNLLHDRHVQGVIVNLHDITSLKEVEGELAHRAFHDSLTGLPNRALLHDRIEHALDRTSRTGARLAVLFLDIDNFKTVNDSFGHEAGDDLLREVAARLLGSARNIDTVSRLGGDEFALLIDDLHGTDDAAATADRIQEALSIPVWFGDQLIALSASIGIAQSDDPATASSLLGDADIAMYRAKTAGKGRWVQYEPAMRAESIDRLRLESELATALEAEQFEIVYQPVVDLRTGDLAGFEALLRWNHPRLGVVMPDGFIPASEENGLIVPIGRWVLESACRTLAEWRARSTWDVPLTMAVNLSGRQLASEHIVDHVAHALRTSALPPDALILEITETALVLDPEAAALRLQQLSALGIRIAIDDFGTGYSSLSYLSQFPVSIIKIDRSFINTINHGDEAPALIRGLLDLGRTLDLEIVAEGVEDATQHQWLRDQRCDFAQGFLFARPMHAADAAGLATRKPRRLVPPQPTLTT